MKIAIIQYSTYGHITVLSETIKKSIDATGLATQVDILQVPETLPQDVLEKMHAAPKPGFPIATPECLIEYDAFMFGYPTRFGNLPAQFIDFWGATGGLWANGELHGKTAGVFVSTGTQGGGQEMTIRNSLSLLAHHGIAYIPLGCAPAFAELTDLTEPHGASPYGAGTFAGADGSRQPSALELKVAAAQGADFVKSALKFYQPKSVPESKNNSTQELVYEKKESTPAPQRTQAPTKETEENSGCAKCIIM